MNVNVPAKVRKIGYIIFGVLAAAQTAAYAAYGSIHADPPAALVAASAAFAAITTAPFVVATLNIPKDDPASVEPLPVLTARVEESLPPAPAPDNFDPQPDDEDVPDVIESDYTDPIPEGATHGPADEDVKA